MAVQAGQIYLAKNAQLGKANYARPCIVLRISPAGAIVAYFSTKFDLFEPGDLALRETDPGFEETGLRESSYWHRITKFPFH